MTITSTPDTLTQASCSSLASPNGLRVLLFYQPTRRRHLRRQQNPIWLRKKVTQWPASQQKQQATDLVSGLRVFGVRSLCGGFMLQCAVAPTGRYFRGSGRLGQLAVHGGIAKINSLPSHSNGHLVASAPIHNLLPQIT